MATLKEAFEIISSLPSIWDKHRHLDPDYLTSIKMGASLADEFGYRGVLLHYNLHAMEPWPVVSVILESTRFLTPLIAAQPTNLPPHTAARLCMTAAALFKRRVDLNLIIGAKPEEQKSVGDTLPHDEKYARLEEYGRVIREILVAAEPYKHSGKWYTYDNFVLSPPMHQALLPRVFVAGASPAALAVARRVADIVVTHPQDVEAFKENIADVLSQSERKVSLSVRVGIIARSHRDEARAVALERFPQTRRGEVVTKMKTKAESNWLRALAQESLQADGDQFSSVFWLGAYRSGSAYCPYLVGSYDEVGGVLSQYHALGARVLLVDGPDTRAEFAHHDAVFIRPTVPTADIKAVRAQS